MNLLHEIARFFPDWPAETWFSLILLIVVAVQAYVAYRLWRPRVEVFARLRTENPGVLHFDFSNLSPTGIWFDSLSIEVKARSPQGFEKASHRHPVRTIVPAFESRSTKCHGDIHYAFKKAINGGEYYAGWLNVRANYWVHGKEQHSEWHKYWIEVGPVVITRLSSEKPNT